MARELKRKKGESFEAFIRRTKRQWQTSGIMLEARKVQFFVPKKSKNVQKKQSVAYAQKLSKQAYLEKIGRLPVEDKTKKKKGRR